MRYDTGIDPAGGGAPGLCDGAASLAARLADRPPEAVLATVIREVFPGRIALVSSFGAESAVLLHMVAGIDPALPVIFLDTGKLFGETQRYRTALTAQLGLTGVRVVRPCPRAVAATDPDGALWFHAPERCCALRKVVPLAEAVAGVDAWITGRKRSHGDVRADLPLVEATGDGRVKINPLIHWTRSDVVAYRDRHGLPAHPLEADGYLSIGCLPCTDRVAGGEAVRAGRWRGLAKTECGIHTRI